MFKLKEESNEFLSKYEFVEGADSFHKESFMHTLKVLKVPKKHVLNLDEPFMSKNFSSYQKYYALYSPDTLRLVFYMLFVD